MDNFVFVYLGSKDLLVGDVAHDRQRDQHAHVVHCSHQRALALLACQVKLE